MDIVEYLAQQSKQATGQKTINPNREMSDELMKQVESDEKNLNERLARDAQKAREAKKARAEKARNKARGAIREEFGQEIKLPSRVHLKRIRQNCQKGLAKYRDQVAKFDQLKKELEANGLPVRVADPIEQIKDVLAAEGSRPRTTSEMLSLPYFDWRLFGIVPRARHQGKCGSCWAFAATAAFESRLMYNVNKYDGLVIGPEGKLATQVTLMVQGVLDCVTRGGCKRGNPFNAFDYFLKYGARLFRIDEKGFRIDDSKVLLGKEGRCTEKEQKNGIKALAWDFVFERNPLAVPKSEAAIRKMKLALLDHGPLVVLVTKGGKEWDNYSGGIWIDDPRSDVNHAVLLTGWDDENRAWIVLNSAGRKWGDVCIDQARADRLIGQHNSNASNMINSREKGCMYIGYGKSHVGKMAVWIETQLLDRGGLALQADKSAGKKDGKDRPADSGKPLARGDHR
jgi:papain like protease